MSFLSGLVSNIENAVGGFFGGNSNQKKKTTQQSTPTPAAAPTTLNKPAPALSNTQSATSNPLALPSNGVTLTQLPAKSLKKATPAPTTTPQTTQVTAPTNSQTVIAPGTALPKANVVGQAVPAATPLTNTVTTVPTFNRNQPLQKAQPVQSGTVQKIVSGVIPDLIHGAVQAPIVIGNQIAGAVTGSDVSTNITNPVLQKLAGTNKVGDVGATGKETLSQFGVKNAPDFVNQAVGGLQTALNLTPAAGLEKVGAESAAKAAEKVLPEAVDTVKGSVDEVTPGIKSVNPARSEAAPTPVEPVTPDPAAVSDPASAQEVDSLPAYQRGFGTPQSTAVRDFQLDQKYSQLIKARPDLAPQLRARLQDLKNTPLEKQLPSEVQVPQISAEHPDAQKIVAQNTPPPEPAPIEPQPIDPNAINDHESAALKQLNTDAQTRKLTPEELNMKTALQQKADDIKAANNPEQPKPAPTAQTAPQTRQAVLKTLGDTAKGLKKEGENTRTPVSLDDLKSNATSQISSLKDEDVISSFNDHNLNDTLPNDENGTAVLRAGIDRLGKIARENDAKGTPNDDVASALENAIEAYTARGSQAGLTQRMMQEDFNTLPVSLKTKYIIKNIDKANKDVKGYTPLAERPDDASIIDKQITDHLNTGEDLQNKLSQLQDQSNTKLADVKSSNPAEARKLSQQIEDAKLAIAQNNQKLVNYYDTLTPGLNKGQQVNNFARNAMLASISGRVNDVVTTGANVLQGAPAKLIQGGIAKAADLVKPGAITDTSKGFGSFVKGTVNGIKAGVRGFTKAGNGTGDLQKALTANTDARTGLNKAKTLPGRIVQGATDFATSASRGVRDQALYQMADKEGRAAGYTGKDLKTYTELRAGNPTAEMTTRANEAHDEVNNLNQNPISTGLGKISKAIGETKPSPGDSAYVKAGKVALGTLKNQVLPFTSYLGGNIWNSITDKNVVANVVKIAASAGKGDINGVVENLSKAASNATQTYALGYGLTKAGIITNTDAEGYNDGGAYFHIGDHYIPVGITGFFSPNIILGNALYQGINDTKAAGNTAQKIGDAASAAFQNLAKNIGLGSVLGTDNSFLKTITAGMNGKQSALDTAASAGSNIVGQFIPAISGDINSFLNNETNLNPTKEAANTTVTKTSAAGNQIKDVGASAIPTFLNKIPGVSQTLPRKAGVAAPDAIDRVGHGDHATTAEKQAVVDAKNTAKSAQTLDDRIKANQKAGIPDPDANNSKDKTLHYAKGDSFANAVENRIENKKYDQAQSGLEQQLRDLNRSKDVTSKQTAPVEKQIAVVKTLKQGNYDPSIRDEYSSTSLSAWRELGNPKSSTYDPAEYQKLYQYDSDLAKNGGSDANDPKTNKFTAKEVSTSSSKKGSSAAADLIKSNTLGSTPNLTKIDLSNLAPQKISTTIPTIQNIPSSQLIKKRTISVSPTK